MKARMIHGSSTRRFDYGRFAQPGGYLNCWLRFWTTPSRAFALRLK